MQKCEGGSVAMIQTSKVTFTMAAVLLLALVVEVSGTTVLYITSAVYVTTYRRSR
jgi:hypothetical protein